VDYEGRGIDLSSEPRLAEAVLLDLFPEATAEVNALVDPYVPAPSNPSETGQPKERVLPSRAGRASRRERRPSRGPRPVGLGELVGPLSLGGPADVGRRCGRAIRNCYGCSRPPARPGLAPKGSDADLGEHRPKDLAIPSMSSGSRTMAVQASFRRSDRSTTQSWATTFPGSSRASSDAAASSTRSAPFCAGAAW